MKSFYPITISHIWMSDLETDMVIHMESTKTGDHYTQVSQPKYKESMWSVQKFVCGVKSPVLPTSKPKSGSEQAL